MTTATTGGAARAVRRRAPADRRLLARRQLPVGRPDLPAGQPAAARAARAGPRQAAPARPLGHDPGPQPPLRPPQPRHQARRPGRDLHHRARATAARRSSPTPTWRGPTARSTRRSPATRTGMRRLFRQFSFPGGIPSHVAPETPGSIHEGGELGYALVARVRGGVRQPGPAGVRVVGDGEAETGPLATSWHSQQVPRPGHATAPSCRSSTSTATRSPTRRSWPGSRRDELAALMEGYGHTPYFVEGDDPAEVHQQLAATLDTVVAEIREIQRRAREDGVTERPRWPMIVLRTPKGWTGPSDDRRQAGRGQLALAPGADGRGPRPTPSTAPSSRTWMRSLPARGAVRRARRAASRSSPTLRARGRRGG